MRRLKFVDLTHTSYTMTARLIKNFLLARARAAWDGDSFAELTHIDQWFDDYLEDRDAALKVMARQHDGFEGAVAVSYVNRWGEKRWVVGGWCEDPSQEGEDNNG